MNEEMKFLEKLQELKAFAYEHSNRISKEDVNQFFEEETLTEEQMLLVYDYLLSQKISVTGYMKSGDILSKKDEGSAGGYTAEEEAYLSEYKSDLSAIKKEQPGERRELSGKLAGGDEEVKTRLIEIYLPVVLEIALEMRCQEVFLADLVQEGNVSLMLALELLKLEFSKEQSEADIDVMLRKEIRQGIQMLIEEQAELKRCDKKMEQQVNDLDEALHHLADEKGRAITIDELAEHMKISEEEILDIMKLAGEDLYDKYKDSRS